MTVEETMANQKSAMKSQILYKKKFSFNKKH